MAIIGKNCEEEMGAGIKLPTTPGNTAVCVEHNGLVFWATSQARAQSTPTSRELITNDLNHEYPVPRKEDLSALVTNLSELRES